MASEGESGVGGFLPSVFVVNWIFNLKQWKFMNHLRKISN